MINLLVKYLIRNFKELLKQTNDNIEEYSGKLVILNKLLPEWTSHSYKVKIHFIFNCKKKKEGQMSKIY